MQLNLGASIRSRRKAMGLTQEQLAEALGVTTGAVYKWESAKAVPELTMLVQIAQFFEISVDALLDYGWQSQSMGQTAEQIRSYRYNRNFQDGIPFSERALQKFPNSFPVVYQSAMLNYMQVFVSKGESSARAIELFERAINLIDQNTDETIGVLTIQNQIAGCYCYLNNMDKAIEILQQNNIGGLNNSKIGLLMSQNPEKAEQSLQYLSDALHNDYARIYEVCIGYANAYRALGRLNKIEELMLWLLAMGKGLKEPDTVNFIDKADIRIYTILAETRMLRGDQAGAEIWLQQAKNAALKFDADPHYSSAYGMKFYHSSPQATSYDDMGETGMAMIENYMADGTIDENLRQLWQKIRSDKS